MDENTDTLEVTEAMKQTYRAMMEAYKSNALAVISTTRKSDGKQVGIVTALLQDDESIIMIPMAVLLPLSDADEYVQPEIGAPVMSNEYQIVGKLTAMTMGELQAKTEEIRAAMPKKRDRGRLKVIK